jgi:tetratricopeptide (TPR) repeat protein
MAAVRALGRRLVGVFAADADGTLACAGLTVRPPSELEMAGPLWVVAACASPADVTALYAWAPIARTVHVVEPASIRPAAPPFATYPSLEGLAYARERHAAGAHREAEAAYRAVLRDPGCTEIGAARRGLALVHEAMGKLREAEAGLRRAFRHVPEERGTIVYNLGSFYERQGRWAGAERAFARALALAGQDDLARRGGCHFHLGEIALAQGHEAVARDHYARALEALPGHGKARARLDALVRA